MKVNASEILLIDVTFYPQNGKKNDVQCANIK